MLFNEGWTASDVLPGQKCRWLLMLSRNNDRCELTCKSPKLRSKIVVRMAARFRVRAAALRSQSGLEEVNAWTFINCFAFRPV
jgi:hypothetical protein